MNQTTDLPIHLDGDWRRRTPRIEVLGQLHGTLVAMDVPILVSNIGAGGFGIESAVPFPPGATHAFRFTAGSGLRVVLKASARHCQETMIGPDGATRYHAGFEFIHEASGDTERIITLLLDAVTASLTVQ